MKKWLETAHYKAKFLAVLEDAKKAGEAIVEEKLKAFAKEAGYDVSIDEMNDFFKEMAEKEESGLSEMELDMVAGEKSELGAFNILLSELSLGIWCAYISATSAIVGKSCSGEFK